MIDFLNSIDTKLLLFFNGMHTDFLDRFMMILTGKFVWIPMYVALLVIIFSTFGRRKGMVYLLMLAGAIVAADQVCSEVLRPLFCRMRPSNPDNPISAMVTVVDGYRGGRYGFPSCHGSNSFCLAVFMSLLIRKRLFSGLILGWALLHCYTRIYLGVHYPGDILTGAVIGSLVAWAFYQLALALCHRFDIESQEVQSRSFFRLPVLARVTRGGIDVTDRTIHFSIFLLTLLLSGFAAML